MAVMGFALGASEGVDTAKCIKMALIHDLGESIIGDIGERLSNRERGMGNRE